jgi:hypothetical protein
VLILAARPTLVVVVHCATLKIINRFASVPKDTQETHSSVALLVRILKFNKFFTVQEINYFFLEFQPPKPLPDAAQTQNVLYPSLVSMNCASTHVIVVKMLLATLPITFQFVVVSPATQAMLNTVAINWVVKVTTNALTTRSVTMANA